MRLAENVARIVQCLRARFVIGCAHDDDRCSGSVGVGLYDEVRTV